MRTTIINAHTPHNNRLARRHYPFLAVARELLRRGHEPTILTNPTFRTLIESNRIAFEGLGDDKSVEEQMRDSPEIWDPSKANSNVLQLTVAPLLKPTYERVFACAGRGCADLVVVHHACFSALWGAEKAGVPAAVCVLAPFYWLSRHESLCDARLGVLPRESNGCGRYGFDLPPTSGPAAMGVG